MIITECTNCEPIFYPYEAGDKGAGGYVEVICKKCKAKNYIELVSIGGITLPEEIFKKLHLKKRKLK